MRKWMVAFVVAVFGLLTSLVSCIKGGPNCGCEPSPFKQTSLRYQQTQCADVWGYGNSDSATLKMVYRYLDSMGLLDRTSRFFIQTDTTKLIKCLSCDCPSGKLIWLLARTDSLNADRLERLRLVGFR